MQRNSGPVGGRLDLLGTDKLWKQYWAGKHSALLGLINRSSVFSLIG
jgi:hypothetical protein